MDFISRKGGGHKKITQNVRINPRGFIKIPFRREFAKIRNIRIEEKFPPLIKVASVTTEASFSFGNERKPRMTRDSLYFLLESYT